MTSQAATTQTVQAIIVESRVLREGAPIPLDYTTDGRNISPDLTWRNVPSGARSLVVAVEDLDYRADTPALIPMLHWVVYNISPGVTSLAEGYPLVEVITAPMELAGACQAHVVFDRFGYNGPQPLPGELHRYRFSVYALDRAPDLAKGQTARQVMLDIAGNVIAQGHLTATYQRDAR